MTLDHATGRDGAGTAAPAAARDVVLRFDGTTHAVRCHGCPEVADLLRQVLRLWPVAEAPTTEDAPIRVFRDGEGYRVEAPWLEAPMGDLSGVAAVCCAIVDIAQSWLEARPDHLCLHAAAIEIAGRLVVFAGQGRAGKSTLAARLAAEDVAVYCDDSLPIVAGPEPRGIALGAPPRLRFPLPAAASETFRNFVGRHCPAHDHRYGYVQSPAIAAHGRSAPIGAVVLLDRRRDGPAGFRPVGPAETLRYLLLRNLRHDQPSAALAERMHALMANTLNVRLFYSDLEDAVALAMETFARWPAPAAGALASPHPPGRPFETAPRGRTMRGRGVAAGRMFVRAPGLAVRALDGELFLIDVEQQGILNLNPLAAGVWNLLAEPTSRALAAEALGYAFPDVDPARIEGDVARLFADLFAHGLIRDAGT